MESNHHHHHHLDFRSTLFDNYKDDDSYSLRGVANVNRDHDSNKNNKNNNGIGGIHVQTDGHGPFFDHHHRHHQQQQQQTNQQRQPQQSLTTLPLLSDRLQHFQSSFDYSDYTRQWIMTHWRRTRGDSSSTSSSTSPLTGRTATNNHSRPKTNNMHYNDSSGSTKNNDFSCQEKNPQQSSLSCLPNVAVAPGFHKERKMTMKPQQKGVLHTGELGKETRKIVCRRALDTTVSPTGSEGTTTTFAFNGSRRNCSTTFTNNNNSKRNTSFDYSRFVTELAAYKKIHGHVRVPLDYHVVEDRESPNNINYPLGFWLHKVRQDYIEHDWHNNNYNTYGGPPTATTKRRKTERRKSSGGILTPERVAMLEELGMEWTLKQPRPKVKSRDVYEKICNNLNEDDDNSDLDAWDKDFLAWAWQENPESFSDSSDRDKRIRMTTTSSHRLDQWADAQITRLEENRSDNDDDDDDSFLSTSQKRRKRDNQIFQEMQKTFQIALLRGVRQLKMERRIEEGKRQERKQSMALLQDSKDHPNSSRRHPMLPSSNNTDRRAFAHSLEQTVEKSYCFDTTKRRGYFRRKRRRCNVCQSLSTFTCAGCPLDPQGRFTYICCPTSSKRNCLQIHRKNSI